MRSRDIKLAVWGLVGADIQGLEAKICPKTVKITFFFDFWVHNGQKNKKMISEIAFKLCFLPLKHLEIKKNGTLSGT